MPSTNQAEGNSVLSKVQGTNKESSELVLFVLRWDLEPSLESCGEQMSSVSIPIFAPLILKISQDSKKRRETASKKLRSALKEGEELKSERRIYIQFPAASDHKNHFIGQVRFYSYNCSFERHLAEIMGIPNLNA